MLAFTFGISILTGLLFGLVPAWRSSHTDLNTTLKEAAGRSESAGGSHRIRSLLLAGEVALAVLLSVSAGLLLRSFVRVTEVNPGVRTANILTMNVSLPVTKYDTPVKRANFYKDLIARLDTLAGVRSAGAVMFLPLRVSILSFRVAVSGFTIQGRPPLGPDQQQDADYRTATPGYFSTMGIALRRGRLIDDHDDPAAKAVVLVNEALVRKYFPHENPLGQHLVMGKPLEIVGVVADAKLYGLDTPVEPAVYLPQAQAPGGSAMAIVVRTEGDPAALTAAVRREILRLDPEQPVSNVRTMETVLSDSLTLRRVSMMLLIVFASLALTLATRRNLRTDGLFGKPAHARDRIARGVGRQPVPDSAFGSGPRIGHFADRCRRRGSPPHSNLTRGLSGMLYGLRRHRSAGVRRRAAAAHRRFGAGQLCPGAKGHAHRSTGRAALRIMHGGRALASGASSPVLQ